jgi:signal transduction histidine kinase
LDLLRLPLDRTPAEVMPLADSLNKLLGRLSESIDRERSFTADAAHESRTPLAAIQVQAELALTATEGEQRRRAIEHVIAGVHHTSRLVQRLLQMRLDHADARICSVSISATPRPVARRATRMRPHANTLSRPRSTHRQTACCAVDNASRCGDDSSLGVTVRFPVETS